mmetsp:Transcript_45854/g.108913  ORF Transcript_45854/g.108913 Transcript_45854/m.108913 type:complete len:238 (-) Transcript_45854:653-1366(-)
MASLALASAATCPSDASFASFSALTARLLSWKMSCCFSSTSSWAVSRAFLLFSRRASRSACSSAASVRRAFSRFPHAASLDGVMKARKSPSSSSSSSFSALRAAPLWRASISAFCVEVTSFFASLSSPASFSMSVSRAFNAAFALAASASSRGAAAANSSRSWDESANMPSSFFRFARRMSASVAACLAWLEAATRAKSLSATSIRIPAIAWACSSAPASCSFARASSRSRSRASSS